MNDQSGLVSRMAATCLGAALAVVACSSSKSGAPTGAGQTGTSGSSSGQTGAPGSGSESTDAPGTSPDQAGPPDASATGEDASSGPAATLDGSGGCSTSPGVTATTVDAGAESPTWSCIEANCGSQLATCAADCKCNGIILKALFASHDLASANDAFTAALSTGSPPGDAILVGVCLKLNQANCPTWGASAADAAAGD